jgi:pimeloyl-ACP methyl ester carboxylesterase
MIKKFSLDDVEIEAIIDGLGEVVVLLAGLGGEASVFEEFTPFLNKAGYKTVAINLRGIAGSKGVLENLTLHDLTCDVAGVIELLGSSPIHVLGWAFGNRIARCLAEDCPHLVKTVTLLAAGGKFSPDPEALRNLQKFFNPNLSKKERLNAAQLSLFSPSTDSDTVNKAIIRGRSWPYASAAHSKANQITPIMEWWASADASNSRTRRPNSSSGKWRDIKKG